MKERKRGREEEERITRKKREECVREKRGGERKWCKGKKGRRREKGRR